MRVPFVPPKSKVNKVDPQWHPLYYYIVFFIYLSREKVKIGVTLKIVDETVKSQIPIFTYANSGVTSKIVG